ncbi:hypothetical protein FHU31_002524 [Mycolicibacterium fluoranthenivorans]|uniref:Uncharacterized protein n=1 Tax=Mycolicibacterium fluoranthenivorans TaxID=258505 RepID=A0A7X5TZD3_9MYCO|nr:hypothetical protein [Mycolicibacterium fluoranthenivorans]
MLLGAQHQSGAFGAGECQAIAVDRGLDRAVEHAQDRSFEVTEFAVAYRPAGVECSVSTRQPVPMSGQAIIVVASRVVRCPPLRSARPDPRLQPANAESRPSAKLSVNGPLPGICSPVTATDTFGRGGLISRRGTGAAGHGQHGDKERDKAHGSTVRTPQ